ncbi:hypothetical protein JPSP19_25980 [Staphylococcus pseudintermedius]
MRGAAVHGTLFHEHPDDVAAVVLKGVLNHIDGTFQPDMVEDVIVANAFPEG